MKKTKIIQYIGMAVVVVVLICGIFSIAKRLTGTSSTNTIQGDKSKNKGSKESTTEEKLDNSIPMTKLTITAPAGYVRVGKSVQLDIKTEPANASNTKLKWSCSDKELNGLIKISKEGVVEPQSGSEKHKVTMTAKATDGSGLKASVDLIIYPEIDPSQPLVAVTFDDGPNPDTTNVMLDTLEQNYAAATFFCLGQNVDYYPEVVKREHELGMEVATHTYSHKQLTTLTGAELENEVSKSVDSIKKAINVAPTLMRPPYGSENSEVLATVKKYNLCCVNWSLDTEDWRTKNADATYSKVMTATDGDVILLHDIHQYNVAAVQRFVPDLIAQGFQLVTVSELYEARGEKLLPGTKHFRTDPTTQAAAETQPAEAGDSAVEPEEGTTTVVSEEPADTETSEDVAETTTGIETETTADSIDTTVDTTTEAQ